MERLEARNLLATLFWQGDVDADWGTVGNWASDAAGTPTNLVPVSGDTLHFDGATVGLTSFVANNNIAGLTGLTIAVNDANAVGDFTLGGPQGFGFVQLTNNLTVGTATNVTAPLTMAAAAGITNSAGATSTLNISGGINKGSSLLTITATGVTTISGPISGGGGLTKTGAAALELTAANTYGGTTTIAGPLVLSGGNDRLPVGTTLAFSATGSLDLGGNSQTLSSLTVPNITANIAITGAGGSLLINGAANLELGPGGALTTNPVITFDMSGLSNFAYNAPANSLRVGLKNGATNTSALAQVTTVTLAQNNTITAANLFVGDVSASSDGGISTLRLGQTNSINVDTLNVGYSGRSDATLEFNTGLTNPTAIFRGVAGGSTPMTTWAIGNIATFAGAAQTTFAASVNLLSGSTDALVTTVNVGTGDTAASTNRAGTQNSTVTIGAGTFTTTTLNIGRLIGAGAIGANYAANGTFIVNSAIGTLNAGNVVLAHNSNTATGAFTKTVTGTLQLLSGAAANVSGSITDGGGTSSLLVDEGTMTIATGLTVDTLRVGRMDANSGSATLTVSSGAVSIGTGTQNLDIGIRDIALPSNQTGLLGTFDVRQASSVSINVAAVRIGHIIGSPANEGTAAGNVLLSTAGLNTITANSIIMSNSQDRGNGALSTLQLGGGTNELFTDLLRVGGQKGQGQITNPSNGSLTLRGKAAGTLVNVELSNSVDGTGVVGIGSLNMGTGTITADINELRLGRQNGGGGTATGTLTFRNGVINAANVFFAIGTQARGTIQQLGGTFNISGAVTDGTGIGNLQVDGGTMTIASGLQVDNARVGAATVAGTITGVLNVNAGAVSIGTGTGNSFSVGRAIASGVAVGTANFQNTTSVTVNVGDLDIGRIPNTTAGTNTIGTLNLSLAGTNTITATNLRVGDSDNPGNDFVSSTLALGGGVNNLNVDTFLIGGRKSDGSATIVPGGTLNLQGRAGAGALTNLLIADNNTGTAAIVDATLDLTGATFNAALNELRIGRHNNGAGAGKGTLIFDAGTVSAVTVVIGESNVGSGAGASTTPANTNGSLVMNGGSFTVTGNLTVGLNGGIGNIDANAGTFSVGTGATSNFLIGRRTEDVSGSAGTWTSTVDLTGVTSFTANVALLGLGTTINGGGGQNNPNGVLIGATTNDITATTITLADSDSVGLGGVQNRLRLGATNTINATTISVGRNKGVATLDFVSPGSTLTLGSAGARVDLIIGDQIAGTGGGADGTVDFTNGTVTAFLDELILGRKTNAATGTTRGTLNLVAGTIDANSLTTAVRADAGNAGIVTGTINLSGGTLLVSGNTTLGQGNTGIATNTNTTGTLNVSGTGLFQTTNLILGQNTNANGVVNQTGGTVQFVNLSTVAGSLPAYNWTSGTIQNRAGQNLTNTNVNITLLPGSSQTFLIDNGQTATISAAAQLVGAGGFTKDGQGTLLLPGAHTYAGTTNINRGRVTIQNAASLGSTAGGTIINGNDGNTAAVLELNPTAPITVAEPLTLNANAIGRVSLLNSAQNNTWSGNIVTNSTTTGNFVQLVSNGGGLNITGDITGTLTNGFLVLRGGSNGPNALAGNVNVTGTVFKTDAGTWTIGAAGKTYAWTNTQIAAGTILLGKDDALPTNNVLVMGQASGTVGQLNLNGFNQTVAGLDVDNGSTSASAQTITNSGAAATFTINNSAAFTYEGRLTGNLSLVKSGSATQTLSGTGSNTYTGSTTINAGTLTLQKSGGATAIPGNVAINAGSLTLAAANQIADAATVTISGGAYNSATFAETLTNMTIDSTTLSNVSNLTVTNLLNVLRGIHDINSNTSLTAHTVSMSGNSSIYLGANSNPTTFNIGAGGLTMNGATIRFGNLGGAAHAATVNLAGDFTGSGTNLFDAQSAQGILNLGTATRTFNVTGGETTVEVRVAGTAGLTKQGSGDLILAGNNTYTGTTTISGGTLVLTGGNALVDTNPVVLDNVAGALLRVNTAETIGALSGGGPLGGDVNIATTALTVGDASDTTFAGAITGGTLNKQGTGVLTLTGNNVYAGGTNVLAGTLLANNTTGLSTGMGPVNVSVGATLGGIGGIAGSVDVRGTLAPGDLNAPGRLTIAGPLHLRSTSTFVAQIQGSTPGTQYDQVRVIGFAFIEPGAQANLTSTANIAPPTTLTLIDNGNNFTPWGTFANLAEGQATLLNGQRYYVTYQHNGFDFALIRNNTVTANDDNFGPILMNAPFQGNVKDNADPDGPDEDLDGDGTFSIVTGPTRGTVVLDPLTGDFTYTPSANYTGLDTFVYRLSDGEFSDTATVTLTISQLVVDGSTLYVAGTNGADRIVISAGIQVRIGNINRGTFTGIDSVIVYGNSGDDTITAASNVNIPVTFYGDAGNDYLAGGAADDLLVGGIGNDRLLGGSGHDVLYGGHGSDTLAGGAGNDILHGDNDYDREGSEVLLTTGAKDTINGDAGDDIIYGGAGADVLNGGAGHDYIDGGADNDTLDGGDGHDLLFGGTGADKLNGRAGRDVLLGGSGIDSLLGGTGADLLYGGNLSNTEHSTLWDLALLWQANDTATATSDLAALAVDDVLADTLHGEGDHDWFLIFKLDSIHGNEKFPANTKLQLP